MTKISKRYSIRVNGIQFYQFQNIKKTVAVYKTLINTLSKQDNVCVYDRMTNTYLY